MFKKLFKRPKARVFLGDLAVVPRSDTKRYFEDPGFYGVDDLDGGLRERLNEIFSLPPKQEATDITSFDLGLDVVISKFQTGDYAGLVLEDFVLPLIWRPKITIASRLYFLESNETSASFSVTEKLKWAAYFRRMVSWRGLSPMKRTFGQQDMDKLLYKATIKLLAQMQKSI